MLTLKTERLTLRNYSKTDFSDIKKFLSNEKVSEYEDFYPMTDEEISNIIEEWKDLDNRLVVELNETHTVVGSVGYWTDAEAHHCIDFDFNPAYNGNGYATEAATEMVHYLFHTVGVTAVYGDCDVRNESSWKLLERLGFQRMQQLDNQSYKNDENNKPILISTYLYGLEKQTDR